MQYFNENFKLYKTAVKPSIGRCSDLKWHAHDFDEVDQNLSPGEIETVSNDTNLRYTNPGVNVPEYCNEKKMFKPIVAELNNFEKTAIRNYAKKYYRRQAFLFKMY